MSLIKSSQIPVALVFICGLIVSVSYFLNIPILNDTSEMVQNWAVILAGFTVGLGAIAMIVHHVQLIQKSKDNQRIYSILLVSSLGIIVITGLIDFNNLQNPIFVFMSSKLIGPLGSAMYSMLGFWILSAAARAMKLKTVETGVFLVVTVLVMLGNAPIGGLISPSFVTIGTWIANVPAAAGVRAILIGAGLSGALLALKILLGYEKRYLGER